jgi:hypothetical protein
VTADGLLVGAWTRSRLVVDGSRCVDRSQVLWLQTDDWYAHIQIPHPCQASHGWRPEAILSRPWAFAGTSTWRPPLMTWHHRLDSMREPITESGPLEGTGDLIIEAGSFKWAGITIPFRQEWRRISPPDAQISAELSPRHIQLTVGERRISMADGGPAGAFVASMLTLVDGGWCVLGELTEPPCG